MKLKVLLRILKNSFSHLGLAEYSALIGLGILIYSGITGDKFLEYFGWLGAMLFGFGVELILISTPNLKHVFPILIFCGAALFCSQLLGPTIFELTKLAVSLILGGIVAHWLYPNIKTNKA